MSKMQVGRKQYRSMRGISVDMELLRKKNELTPAVGNARVNARGDQLGPGGKIIKKREDVIKDYYTGTTDGAGHTNKKKDEAVVSKNEISKNEAELFEDDEVWVEDAEGNFVKKGE